MSDLFEYENDADLSIAVYWTCATSENPRFNQGMMQESAYSNGYAFARGAALVAVTKWLFHEAGITHGYGRSYSADGAAYLLALAEEILAAMAEVGPEPVRALRLLAKNQLSDAAAED